MKGLIFIGGVHGVGKTTICESLVNTYQIPAYSASNIISKLKKQNLPSEKLIPDIDINQALLIAGLKDIKAMKNIFFLDGHFCLLNEKRDISKISDQVFQQIEPIAFIIVTDTVSRIVERLKRRDNIDYEFNLIEQFQNEEIRHAVSLSHNLNIPHYIYNQNLHSENDIHKFITELGVVK
ncbi:ATP-binding protein [Paenibacillus woosongensis]|uniref:ATP-binding protein n=1 Tax=Paenibacillus woosongensis TaxID=307580 RepID=A0AA95IB79_9BACL|nr:ATP-binding protein [Paenibacillus woosongensis]WHX49385.1 ATP-binding protein [Paenibacillus woosongensis]